MNTFKVGWLYPDLMNIYGDRGNVITLLKRAQWRGFDAQLVELPRRTGANEMQDIDVFFFGGGQDREQELVFDDLLEHKSEPLKKAIGGGAQVLTVCGGYQLLGDYYETAEGRRFGGIGVIDAHTEGGSRRCIGNVVVELTDAEVNPETLVGFENHSGRTFLGPKSAPLGRVVHGNGNNGQDGYEGAIDATGNVIGTYLHGPLLPKNPHLADRLILRALRRRGIEDVQPLDDSAEWAAHERALKLASR